MSIDDDEAAAPLDDEALARAFDYHEAIRNTAFAEDYDITDEDIDRIDFALNEYTERLDDADIKRLREHSRSAGALLEQAARAIRRAVRAVQAIESNHYATSALIAAHAELMNNDRNDDEKIDDLNAATDSIQLLEKVIVKADEQKQYSDGLPVFGIGAPDKIDELRLIYRLNEIVCRICERGWYDVGNIAPGDQVVWSRPARRCTTSASAIWPTNAPAVAPWSSAIARSNWPV